ncbi:MAG: hypothetical protein DDT22_00865 [candidate division WS2 bacterium]|nr:hypothetical protein [Candidatus Lithacetigena glycinireducens]
MAGNAETSGGNLGEVNEGGKGRVEIGGIGGGRNNRSETGATDRNTDRKTKEKSVGLAIVDVPKPKEKKREKLKEKEEDALQENLNILLISTFDVIALKAGKHWQLAKEEADAISKPAAKILMKQISKEKTDKYGDYIVLFIASLLTVIPRIIITKELKEQENIGRKREVTNNTQSGTTPSAASVADSIKELQPSLSN